jgi:hypothetical protein
MDEYRIDVEESIFIVQFTKLSQKYSGIQINHEEINHKLKRT